MITMNILIHAHEFNIKEGGPCTKRMKSFAEAFCNGGHNVTVITSSHNKINEMKFDFKYNIKYSYSTKKIKGSTFQRLSNNLIFGITSFFKSIFCIGKIDLVITTSPPPLISIFAYLISKVKRAKLVYDVRDIWPDVALEMESFKKKSIYYKVFKYIADFMYKKSSYITTVSSGKMKKIKAYCKNSKKVWYIPNGLDDDFLKFNIDKNIVDKYNLNKKFTIVYIGNVGLAQNLDAMVELAKNNIKNDNIQFLIFGEGAYKEKLIDNINSLKLNNISVVGKIDYALVYTILKYAKISFVSLKNNNMTDSIPTKMFDALGVGCPVLLLAKGDSVKILEESKLGEHAENFEQLNVKLNYMIKNYQQYESRKNDCIKYIVNNYSRKRIAQRLEEKVVKNVK